MTQRQERGLDILLPKSKRRISSPLCPSPPKRITIDPCLASLAGKPSLSRSARRILADHVSREHCLHMLGKSRGIERKYALSVIERTKEFSTYTLLFAIAVADTTDPDTVKLLKAVSQTSRYSIVKDAARKALGEGSR